MVRNAAFLVKHGLGEFIGIVAFDPEKHNARSAAREAWGADAEYSPELGWEELKRMGEAGGRPVFTASVNS